jgi:hypothetical protein
MGEVSADMAKAGVELRKTQFPQWDLITRNILEELILSTPFVNVIYVGIKKTIKTP